MPVPVHSSKPKILIPEKVSPDGLALLKDQFDVDEKKGLSPDEIKSIIGDYEALIVRSETKVTADLISAAKKLKVVARAGVGVDNVDVKAATQNGIIVVNSPSGNINAAAEHTIARKWQFLAVFCRLCELSSLSVTCWQFLVVAVACEC
jgi:D-3-phosphoglycerate dehydrogenase